MFVVLTALALAAPPAEPDVGSGLPYAQAGIQGVEYYGAPLVAASHFHDHACLDVPGDFKPYAIVRPFPLEDGHYYAKRVVPPATPYFVDEVTYYLHDLPARGGYWGCDATLTHDVVFYRGTLTGAPDTNPVEVHRATVSQSSGGTWQAKVVALDPPIRLDAGESLWVAIEMVSGPSMSDPGSCLVLCPNSAAASADAFWSNTVAAPYGWMPMSHYGHTNVAPLVVTGRYPEP